MVFTFETIKILSSTSSAKKYSELKSMLITYRDRQALNFTDISSKEFVAGKFKPDNDNRKDAQVEIGNKLFEILKRSNTTELNSNNIYIDPNPLVTNYYRLRKIDKKGIPIYSNVVELTNPLTLAGVTVYPNPAKDVLNVSMPVNSNKLVRLLVTDVAGRIVISQAVQGIKSERNYQLDISQLNPGTYFLKLTGYDKEHTGIKFVKL
jgi:hypothetical protein